MNVIWNYLITNYRLIVIELQITNYFFSRSITNYKLQSTVINYVIELQVINYFPTLTLVYNKIGLR